MNNLNLTYRQATLEDFDDFYAIKADKENIAWGGFTAAPNRVSFYEWYKRQLDSDCRWIYLVFCDSKCCAFFYVDRLEDGTYEAASSGVLTEYMGKGIGTYALSKQIAEIQRFVPNGGYATSWVSEKNVASYKRYEKLGFVRTREFELKNLPLLGGEHKFYKWIKML